MSKRFILSRTDSIGDVVLTLPMAGIIKEIYPDSEIWFIGRKYTEAVVSISEHVDHFIDWSIAMVPSEQMDLLFDINADAIIHVFPDKSVCKAAKRANIPQRIATGRRWHTLFTCNNRINFSRKKSDLHEAILNTKLLKGIRINQNFTEEDIVRNYGFSPIPKQTEKLSSILNTQLLEKEAFTILHPLSSGSAVEWGIDNFSKLAKHLTEKGEKVILTGTEKEGEKYRSAFQVSPSLIDLSGQLSLEELIQLISSCKSLVANSTGPLHIAAALGKKAIGLYSSRKPIHPGRWKPLGAHAHCLTYDDSCESCEKGTQCPCIEKIPIDAVLNLLDRA